MIAKPPLKTFIRTVELTLSYWKQRTIELDSQAMLVLDEERENLFQALLFGQKLEVAWPDTVEIIWQLRYFVGQMGYWSDWMPLIEWALETYDTSNTLVKFKLLIGYGEQKRHLGRLKKALALHETALQIAVATEEPLLIAEAQCTIAETFVFSRDFQKAESLASEALTFLQRERNEKAWLATALHISGIVAWGQHRYDLSSQYLVQAVALRRELGKTLPLARALNALANTCKENQDFEGAKQCYQEGLMLLAPTAYVRDQLMLNINLGVLYDSQEQWEKAKEVFYQAYHLILQRPSDIIFRAILANNLGTVCMKLGNLEDAELYLEQAIEFRQRQGEQSLSLANSLGTLGEVWHEKGSVERALELYDEAINITQQYKKDNWGKQLFDRFSAAKDVLLEAS